MATTPVTVSEVHAFSRGSSVALALGGVEIPGRTGVAAKVTFADGSYQRVSRIAGDDRWIVDGAWASGSCWPRFWNGEGSRCTLLQVATDDVAAALAAATN